MDSQLIESAYRFCPRCAAENPQPGSVPFRCGQCGFVHFFGPVAAVGALISNDDHQLLLVRRARDPGKGRWGLPGGFVDREETIEQAIAREVLEETSLRVVGAQYLMSHPNHYLYQGMIAQVIDLFYCCLVDNADQISLEPDELDHHEWVRPTDAYLDQMAFHSNRLAIEQWLTLES
jgi:NADH pyrophosphatase NudC (nudix superfamily)